LAIKGAGKLIISSHVYTRADEDNSIALIQKYLEMGRAIFGPVCFIMGKKIPLVNFSFP